jgi:HJR/Mrr/RecB family endonuclease
LKLGPYTKKFRCLDEIGVHVLAIFYNDLRTYFTDQDYRSHKLITWSDPGRKLLISRQQVIVVKSIIIIPATL